jgi:hypothetical protein
MEKIKLSFFSVLIVFSSMLLFSSCGNGRSGDLLSGDVVNNPNSADGKHSGNLPVMEFEKDFHDFGRVIQGEKVSYSFKFTNTGNSDLIISKVSSTCGCTVPDFPKTPIGPGDTQKIEVRFDSENRRGFQNKSITVISNTQPNSQVLRIKAEVVLPEEMK